MFHSVRGRKIDVTCNEDLIKKKLKLLTRSFKQFALNQEVIKGKHNVKEMDLY